MKMTATSGRLCRAILAKASPCGWPAVMTRAARRRSIGRLEHVAGRQTVMRPDDAVTRQRQGLGQHGVQLTVVLDEQNGGHGASPDREGLFGLKRPPPGFAS